MILSLHLLWCEIKSIIIIIIIYSWWLPIYFVIDAAFFCDIFDRPLADRMQNPRNHWLLARARRGGGTVYVDRTIYAHALVVRADNLRIWLTIFYSGVFFVLRTIGAAYQIRYDTYPLKFASFRNYT